MGPLATESPVGLFSMGQDGRVREVNPTFTRLTGVSAELAKGRSLLSFLTRASQVLYALKVEPALLARDRADEILLELRRRDDAIPVLVTIAGGHDSPDVRFGALFPAPERRAYELELIKARRSSEEAREARDLLLREVYHRVKNNLQTVDSLLLLQRRRFKEPEAISALETMRQRIFALGLVHHQLMGSSDLRTFDVAAFLRELASHLQDAGGSDAAIHVVAPPIPVGLDFAIPLGLIVTELVTTALRRVASAPDATISVDFQPSGTRYALLGVVYDGDDVADEAGGEDSSLGLSIVRGLVGQLGGRIEASPPPSAAFRIRLPLPSVA